MKSPLIALFGLAAFAISAPVAEKKAPEPHPVTATFFIANVECGECLASITDSLKKVRSFTGLAGLTPESGYANISFDSHANSYHEIANAIASATPAHGTAYVPTLKLKIPDYATGENAANVDKVFAKQAAYVKVEATDRAKGEFVVHFLPLNLDSAKNGPQGFNGGMFWHPIHDAPPKGLGLDFTIVREGAPRRRRESNRGSGTGDAALHSSSCGGFPCRPPSSSRIVCAKRFRNRCMTLRGSGSRNPVSNGGSRNFRQPGINLLLDFLIPPACTQCRWQE